jgi:hypothetical protein
MTDIRNESPAVQMAYQWINAQTRTVNANGYVEHHRLTRWSGYYIGKDAVIRALELAGLKADCYPRTNISKLVTQPLFSRIAHIPEAGTHQRNVYEFDYARIER